MRKEVIHLRTASQKDAETAISRIRSALAPDPSLPDPHVQITLFTHASYGTDICLTLDWEKGSAGESLLGTWLAHLLRDCGLTDHTVWNRIPIADP